MQAISNVEQNAKTQQREIKTMAKKFFKAAAAITLMMTTVVLTSCTRDNDGSAPGEDPVKAELCAEKAQMIPLFYDYIQ